MVDTPTFAESASKSAINASESAGICCRVSAQTQRVTTPVPKRDKPLMIRAKAVGTKRAAPNKSAARHANPATKPSPATPSMNAAESSPRPPNACNLAVRALARAHARGIAGAKMGRRESCHKLLPAAAAAPM